MRESPNLAEVSPSATLAVAALARELRSNGRDIIDLSAGEPDFPTPSPIADAGIAAIRKGLTRYTPVAGVIELRNAIARDLASGRSVDVDPAGIVVSTGAKQALFNAAFALFGPGDRVLVPAPYWTSYPEIIRLARAEPVPVQGAEGRGFKVTPDDLEAAAGADDVAGLLLNSPTNPSGSVYSPDELQAVVAWARSRDVAVISDEIYSRICFTAPRAAGLLDLGPLAGSDVVVAGASKSFAMTGWRIGYSYASVPLARRLSTLQSHVTSNASAPAQYAAVAAFEGAAEADVADMVKAFRARRDLVTSLFDRSLPGLRYVEPHGAFYLFFRVDGLFQDGLMGSVAFCQWLLETAGVALVPGAAFGDDRYVRLSYAAAEDTLRAGIGRLADALAELPAAGAGAGAGVGA